MSSTKQYDGFLKCKVHIVLEIIRYNIARPSRVPQVLVCFMCSFVLVCIFALDLFCLYAMKIVFAHDLVAELKTDIISSQVKILQIQNWLLSYVMWAKEHVLVKTDIVNMPSSNFANSKLSIVFCDVGKGTCRGAH